MRKSCMVSAISDKNFNFLKIFYKSEKERKFFGSKYPDAELIRSDLYRENA